MIDATTERGHLQRTNRDATNRTEYEKVSKQSKKQRNVDVT